MSTGRLVILSGPSGVGKDTVIDQWSSADSRVQRVVAYTTRAPRTGETHGIDYKFVDVPTFHSHVEAGDFLEWKEVHGNFYATPLREMTQMLEAGKIAILKIDVQGALTAMDLRPDALTVILLPPSADELERRIRSRGTDSAEAIERRLQNAREEISFSPRYQHQIENHDISEVVRRLQELTT